MSVARAWPTVGWWAPFAGAVLGGALGLLAGAAIHEGAHVMLFNRYGCTSSLRLLADGLWIAVYPDCPASTRAAAHEATRAAEAVGYHLYLLLGVVGAGLGGRAAYRGGVAGGS